MIPSRFVEGGSDGGLNGFRKLVSWTARSIGRVFLKRLREVSDCTGGYFGFHRQVVEPAKLNPIGWKILMEILIKGRYQYVHEIPYAFVARNAGESKMGIAEQWNYLKHVMKLVWNSPEDRRFYLFCVIGALGVAVNLIGLTLMQNFTPMTHMASSTGASVLAMIHNFLWHDNLTWKGQRQVTWWRKALKMPQFLMISAIGIAVTALLAQLFVFLNLNLYAGQLTGIVAATAWNYIANDKWTWNPAKSQKQHSKIYVTQESLRHSGSSSL